MRSPQSTQKCDRPVVRIAIALPHDLPEENYQVAIVLNPQPLEQPTITPEESQDFFAIAGIWEGKNITQETIRKDASASIP
ncbi:hypothetical protein HC928_21270 [bacterium]|nr:hypothetical protein [bacterium]